eukprot:1159566-Pelagomonas_calceolata.AAC.4
MDSMLGLQGSKSLLKFYFLALATDRQKRTANLRISTSIDGASPADLCKPGVVQQLVHRGPGSRVLCQHPAACVYVCACVCVCVRACACLHQCVKRPNS